jgi:hypothetical protein
MKKIYLLPFLILTACNEVTHDDVAHEAVASETPITFNGCTATVYWAVESQTDDTPFICADGTTADPSKRICAVSRDMLNRWGGAISYGDTVLVSGCGKYNGAWEVHDTMNRRFGRTAPTFDKGVKGVVEPHALSPRTVDGNYHIDFLVPQGEMAKFTNITITLLGGE